MKARGHTSLLSIYGFSIVTTLLTMLLVWLTLGPHGLATMLILCALEITFSFDNAVVNATVLQRMSAFWQRMFMTVGIFIGVFGVRMALPIVLVAASTGLGMGQVVDLALNHPDQYAHDLEMAHPTIASFGGLFLLMIFMDYLINQDWVSKYVAKRRAKLLGFVPTIIALLVLAGVYGVAGTVQAQVLLAGLAGIGAYGLVHAASALFAHPTRGGKLKGGFITFLYLELLDASFSFDGVIGAFAISPNVLLIAAGLGAGAVWVRSMTIHLVRRKVLAHYRYLDAGAHVAILMLSATLLLGISFDIPGLLTGSAGLIIITIAFIASVFRNRRVSRRK